MTNAAVGELVRDWRTRRRRSQLDLSIDVGVSTRHLSFVETGRSRPSPELILAIAHHLEVPLRDRNTMLLAGGYAPRYTQRSLDDASMKSVRASIQRLLDAHDPYPGVAIDRAWNVVVANQAGMALSSGLPAHLAGPPMNIYRVSLHPDGMAARTTNFTEWAGQMLAQLRRAVRLTADPDLIALEREVLAYPNIEQIAPMIAAQATEDPVLLVPFRVSTPLGEVAMFTTLTTFGTPRDVTLEELVVELFFPADESSAAKLRDLAAQRPRA
jgi:transcriptional regulator with XRE-family HTH domain